MSEAIGAIERMYRRIMLMVGRGRIKTSRDDGAAQMHQVRFNALETTDNIPRLGEYGFNSMPPADSDAVLLFAGGNRINGIIIATGNQTFRMRSLKPGEVSISDNLGQSVYLTQAGIVVNGGGLPVMVTNTPEITLDSPKIHATGDMTVDGDLTVLKDALVDGNIVAAGDISDHTGKSMAAMRDVYNGHGHAVTGIQTGNSSVTSQNPGQQQ
jgi:phage baseplate assembly protein V